MRNVVWHGFALQSDISPKFAATLIVLVLSICRFMPKTTTRSKVLSDLSQIETMQGCIAEETLSSLLQKVSKTAESLKTIPPGKKLLLQTAICRFEMSDYLKCLNILLSEMECLCRIVFSRVNSCPERLLTAEADTLYTTFDEMLSQKLPDGSTNLFPEFLGKIILTIFLGKIILTILNVEQFLIFFM